MESLQVKAQNLIFVCRWQNLSKFVVICPDLFLFYGFVFIYFFKGFILIKYSCFDVTGSKSVTGGSCVFYAALFLFICHYLLSNVLF